MLDSAKVPTSVNQYYDYKIVFLHSSINQAREKLFSREPFLDSSLKLLNFLGLSPTFAQRGHFEHPAHSVHRLGRNDCAVLQRNQFELVLQNLEK